MPSVRDGNRGYMMLKIDPRVQLQVRVEQLYDEAEHAYRQAYALMLKSIAIKAMAEELLKDLTNELDRPAKGD
jgi:hypothetical protein